MAGEGLFGTRAGIRPIRPVAIQPTGLPGSTFVRPQQRQTGSNLAALADALGGLNSALQQYGSVAQREANDPDSEGNRAFADSIAGLSLEDAMKKFPEAKNRIQKDGVLSLVGSKAASEFRQTVTDAYNSGDFDQNSGDFNIWIAQKRGEYADRLPNQAMKAAFFRGTEEWTQRFQDTDLKRKLENVVSERDTAVVGEFRMIVDDGIASGTSPEEIAAQVIAQSSQNRTFRGLDGKAQNETLFRLAEEFALKGKPELVKALLNDKRNGVGALIEVSGFTDRGLSLIARADAIAEDASLARSFKLQTKLDDGAANGRLTADQLTALQNEPGNEWLTDSRAAQFLQTSQANKAQLLTRQKTEEDKRRVQFQSNRQRNDLLGAAYGAMEKLGGAAEVEDTEYMGPDGNMKTLSAKEQVETTVRRKLSEFEDERQRMVGNGVPEEQAREIVLKKRVAWFDGNGLVDEDLKKRFAALPIQASVSRLLEKGEVSEHLAGVVQDFQELADINPAYAERLVTDEKTSTFLQNYYDSRRDGMGSNDAMIFAAQQSNRTPTEIARSIPAKADLDEAIDDVLGGLDLSAEPNSFNQAWVEDQLRLNTGRGISLDRAKERVQERLKASAFELNGVLVISDGKLPPDAPELFQMALQDAFQALGAAEGIPDVDDLYVRQFAAKQWLIMSKSKGNAPLSIGSRITLEDLNVKRRKVERERKDAEMALHDADQAKRRRAEADYRAWNERRNKLIDTLKGQDGLSSRWVRYLERRREEEYARVQSSREKLRMGPEMERQRKQREADIKAGKRKGFLEERGIPVPDFSGRRDEVAPMLPPRGAPE